MLSAALQEVVRMFVPEHMYDAWCDPEWIRGEIERAKRDMASDCEYGCLDRDNNRMDYISALEDRLEELNG